MQGCFFLMSHDDGLPTEAHPIEAEPISGGALVPARTTLPATLEAPIRRSRSWRWLRTVLAFCVLGAAIAGGITWWLHRPEGLPPGIASGNGRLEADEIDIETKFPGRVAKLLVDEGDLVKAGQTVAQMDVQDLESQLGKANATIAMTEKTLDEAKANLEQQKALVLFSRQEFFRARELAGKEFMSKEMLDQRQQQMSAATAAYAADEAKVAEAEHALEAARRDGELIRINIADNTLVAPSEGRIQYKISNVGEVLPAGGKVFTMLDTSYVYMDIYLPTADAGQVRLGADALITLDALPNLALPAKVTFLATEAQFTPKAVETKTERDKLMFRVKVRVDQNLLRAHVEEVRTGLPGVAYIRLDPRTAWPSRLASSIAR